MAKKFFAATLLALTLIFVGVQTNTAEAREVYMGSYSDGSAVYLLTETISRYSGTITCTVRAGRDYLDYTFFYRNGSPYYRNSEGYQGYVYGGASPVAAAIYNYCR